MVRENELHLDEEKVDELTNPAVKSNEPITHNQVIESIKKMNSFSTLSGYYR
jgi:hypothetical protein